MKRYTRAADLWFILLCMFLNFLCIQMSTLISSFFLSVLNYLHILQNKKIFIVHLKH